MEPSKMNKIGADSKPSDYPRNIREFGTALEVAARLLMEQIAKCDPIDGYGHKMIDNRHYREMQALLSMDT
jgi:hypothetical protein